MAGIKRINMDNGQQYQDRTGKYLGLMNRQGFSLCAFNSIRLFMCQLILLCITIAFTNPSYAAPDDVLFGETAPALDSAAPEPSKFGLGNYDISEKTGAATYTFPIDVPPGRNGMKPALALSYSSRAPLRGGIAAGWSLQLPSITLDTSSGTLGEVRFMATLGGAAGRLVEVNDTPVYSGTTYRVEQDSTFTRFERTTSFLDQDQFSYVGSYADGLISADTTSASKYSSVKASSGIMQGVIDSKLDQSSDVIVGAFDQGSISDQEMKYPVNAYSWVALTTDGTRHFFGSTPNSTDGSSRWYLDRKVDASGNEVLYHWEKVKNASGEVIDYAISSIEYTSNKNAGLAAHAKIEFKYADDFDTCSGSNVPIGASFSYQSGKPYYEGARRLTAIVTSVNDVTSWRMVQRTTLGYDMNAMSCSHDYAPLRFINQISRVAYAADGAQTILKPITLSYGSSSRTMSKAIVVNNQPSVHHGTDKDLKSSLLEINGDGIPDRVEVKVSSSGSCWLHWYQGLYGGGYAEDDREIRLPSLPWYKNNTFPLKTEGATLAGQTTFWYGNQYVESCKTGQSLLYRFADVDGDGRVDLLTSILHDPQFDPSLEDLHIYLGGEPPIDFGPSTSYTPQKPPSSLFVEGSGISTASSFSAKSIQKAPISSSFSYFSSAKSSIKAPLASMGGNGSQNTEDIGVSYLIHDGKGPNPTFEDLLAIEDHVLPGGNESPGGGGGGGGDCVPPKMEPHRVYKQKYKNVWRIYRNTGNKFEPMAHFPTISPIPLRPEGNEGGRLGNGSLTYGQQAMLDMDGDGLLDLVKGPEFYVYKGNGDGSFGAGKEWPRSVGTYISKTNTDAKFIGYPDDDVTGKPDENGKPVTSTPIHSWGSFGLEDINGDGLPDLLVNPSGCFNCSEPDEELVAYLNHGTGFLQEPISLGTKHYINRSYLLGKRHSEYYHVDVDGDGLQDLLDLRDSEPMVYINVGDGFKKPTPMSARSPEIWKRAERLFEDRGLANHERKNGATYGWRLSSSYMDANGDGLTDLVSWDGSQMFIQTDSKETVPPRRLYRVDNGSGRVIRFAYTPITNPEAVSRKTVSDRNLPHKYWVVKGVTTKDIQADPSTTSYKYSDPIYGSQSGKPLDPRRFLGFSKVEKYLPLGGRVISEFDYNGTGDAEGRLVRETTYDGDGNSFTPVSRREITWGHELLFGNRVTFTHQVEELTHTLLSGKVLRKSMTHTPWENPENSEISLYLLTQTQEGEGVDPGEDYREYLSTHEIHYPPFSGANYLALTSSTEQMAELQRVAYSEIQYDNKGFPVQVDEWIDESSVATTVNTYDQTTGNLHTVTKPEQVASGGGSSSFTYDAHQLFVKEITNELGHVVTEKYDVATGSLLEKSGPNSGQREQWKVDGMGRVVDHFLSVEEGNGGYSLERIEHADYDDMVTPRTSQTEKYDFDGSLLGSTEKSYNGQGQVLTESTLASTGTDATTTYLYNEGGKLAGMEVPDPRSDTGDTVSYYYDYDGLGRVVAFTRPDDNGHSVTYNGLTRRVEEITDDGSGSIRLFTKDVFGRLIEVEEIDGTKSARVWHYSYNTRDELVTILDADENLTGMDYDWAGRRTSITRGARIWRYDYDLNGNVIAKSSPVPAGDVEVDYRSIIIYDDLDRIVRQEPANRGMSPARMEELGIGIATYAYDGTLGPDTHAIGRLSYVSLPIGSVSYDYDNRGLPTFEERAFNVDYIANAGATQWVRREYNAFGQPTYTEHDDGMQWLRTYDVRGLPDTVEWFDPQAGGWMKVADFDRSLAGQVIVRNSDYNQARKAGYDILGRPDIDEINGGQQREASRSYTYNDSGDLTQVNGVNGARSANAAYTYDRLHRLLSADGPMDYSGTFTYSPTGNIRSAQVSWEGSPATRNVLYEYGDVDPQAVDRLVDWSTRSNWATFKYDVSGNMIVRDTPAGSWDFEWGSDDRIRSAIGPDGEEVYYYDHNGNRMLAINGDTGVRFWFAESETHYDITGNQTRRWIHLSGLGSTLARIENGTSTELQYSDSLQNLILSMDDTGVPKSSFLYGAFGEVVYSEGNEDHRRQFNGKEDDKMTGLRYYGFRYYDPITLRWNSADPLYLVVPDIGLKEPQRMNLYTFSLNNPVKYLDPDGRDGEEGGNKLEEERRKSEEEKMRQQQEAESGKESTEASNNPENASPPSRTPSPVIKRSEKCYEGSKDPENASSPSPTPSPVDLRIPKDYLDKSKSILHVSQRTDLTTPSTAEGKNGAEGPTNTNGRVSRDPSADTDYLSEGGPEKLTPLVDPIKTYTYIKNWLK